MELEGTVGRYNDKCDQYMGYEGCDEGFSCCPDEFGAYNCMPGIVKLLKCFMCVATHTVSSGYLIFEVHPKLLISQSKFSGPRKFTLRYH